MAKKSEATDLAKLRMQIQAQQLPTFTYHPVTSIGDGIGQSGDLILQAALQQQQNHQLAQMLADEQKAQQAEAAKKVESLRPLEGLTGQSAETMANIDPSTLNNLLIAGQKESDTIKKAQALQDQFGQTPITLDNPDFTNLDVNGYRLPDAAANMLARDDKAYQQIATASANQQLQNTYHPDLSTMEGRNQYQQLFGTAPTATPNTISQENANLMGTLLGNQHQWIVNRFLPIQNKMGLLKDQLTAEGQGQENNWRPVINAANVANTQAGTTGALLSNEDKANELSLQNRIIDVMSRDELPIERRIALVSTLQSDPAKLVSTLSQLSAKGGVLGSKAADYKKAIDLITKETQAQNTPTPAPVKVQKSTLNPAQQFGFSTRKTLNAVPGMLDSWYNFPSTIGQGVARAATGFMQGFNNQLPASAPAPTAQPITLPGIQQAKAQAQANIVGLNKNINTAQGLLAGSNAAVQDAQNTMKMLDAKQKQRDAKMKQLLGI